MWHVPCGHLFCVCSVHVSTNKKYCPKSTHQNELNPYVTWGVPYGLVVRIPAFHAGGPGSIPGVGARTFYTAVGGSVLGSTGTYVSMEAHCRDKCVPEAGWGETGWHGARIDSCLNPFGSPISARQSLIKLRHKACHIPSAHGTAALYP